jgi:hypothetical protein
MPMGLIRSDGLSQIVSSVGGFVFMGLQVAIPVIAFIKGYRSFGIGYLIGLASIVVLGLGIFAICIVMLSSAGRTH